MITHVRCDQCNKGGSLDCALKFRYQIKFCTHCHHLESSDWSYYFCDIACMMKWMRENQIEELGFPCRACWSRTINGPPVSTGFNFGSEVHGICFICDGNKRVKVRKKDGWEHDKTPEGRCDMPTG